MLFRTNFPSAVLALAFLASCGGSSTESSVEPPVEDPVEEEIVDEETTEEGSYGEIYEAASALTANYLDSEGNLLNSSGIATSDQITSAANAKYNGYVIGRSAGLDGAAELEIVVDFGAGTTRDTLSDFVSSDGTQISGALSGKGEIDLSPDIAIPHYRSTVGGQIDVGSQTVDASVALDGFFVQNDGNPVGALVGTADGVIDGDLYTGEFAAEDGL